MTTKGYIGVICIVMSQICAILFADHALGAHFIYAIAGSAFTWVGISLLLLTRF